MIDRNSYAAQRKDKLLSIEDWFDIEPPNTTQIEPDPSQQTPGDKIAGND